MTDEELSAWVCDLIARRVPESDDLDYKATVNVGTRSEKLELAKDVSSFANERGGTLLYGIPEDDSGEAPVPKELAACGIPIPPNLPETVENILMETVDPPLPECVVRVVSVENAPDKRALLVYHPASWNRPHMTLYKDGRFYRRGNFRAVLMRERDVEAAYAARRATATAAQSFFSTGDFGVLPTQGAFIRVIVSPHLSLVRREVMREREFLVWLATNAPADRRGDWVPFLDGWRFPSYANGALDGHQFEVRLFHSGATACTMDATDLFAADVLMLHMVDQQFLESYILQPASKAFESLRVVGPVTIRVSVHGVVGHGALDRTNTWIANIERGVSESLSRDFTFDEETSAAEMQFNRAAVRRRLMDRLAAAFGMWRAVRQ